MTVAAYRAVKKGVSGMTMLAPASCQLQQHGEGLILTQPLCLLPLLLSLLLFFPAIPSSLLITGVSVQIETGAESSLLAAIKCCAPALNCIIPFLTCCLQLSVCGTLIFSR